MNPTGQVVGVSMRAGHSFSKTPQPGVRLQAGLGVQGDGHAGVTVQHRSRVAADPTQPNLRQVHLLAAELLDELNAQGFDLGPGDLGENLLTRGVDLLSLPTGARLTLGGGGAEVELTGLRNPCAQIEGFRPGLLGRVAFRGEDGETVRRAGVMAVVRAGGEVRPGDPVRVALPPLPYLRLERV